MIEQTYVTCPICNKEGLIETPVDNAGKSPLIRCPKCGESFQHVIEQRLYHRKMPLPWLFYSPAEFNLKGRKNFGDYSDRIYNRIYIGELADLSMTGCKGRTNEYPPRKSERIWLLFRLPDEELEASGGEEVTGKKFKAGIHYSPDATVLIHVEGEVAWSRRVSHASFEFGVQFTDFKGDAQEVIETYLFSFDISDEE